MFRPMSALWLFPFSLPRKLLKKAEAASAKHASAITKNLTRYNTLAETLAGASTMARTVSIRGGGTTVTMTRASLP